MNREVLKKMILAIVPEFMDCVGFQQNNLYHIYDVFDHTIAALEACDQSYDDVTLIAVLLHDIGKPETYLEDENGIGHFHGHAKVSAEIAKDLMKFIGVAERIRIQAEQLIRYHDVRFEETEKCIKKWINELGYKQFIRLLNLRRADVKAQNPIYLEERLAKIDRIEKIINKVVEEKLSERS